MRPSMLVSGVVLCILACSTGARAQIIHRLGDPQAGMSSPATSRPTPNPAWQRTKRSASLGERVTLASLQRGSRVRIATMLDEHRPYVAVVERATADSLVLTSGQRFGRRDLARVEWSTGRRAAGARAGRGAVIGAAVGGTFGLLVPPQETGNGVGQPRSRLEGLVGYGAIGAALGLVTNMLRSGEQWRPVDLSPG